jgi:hypothetical protein
MKIEIEITEENSENVTITVETEEVTEIGREHRTYTECKRRDYAGYVLAAIEEVITDMKLTKNEIEQELNKKFNDEQLPF